MRRYQIVPRTIALQTLVGLLTLCSPTLFCQFTVVTPPKFPHLLEGQNAWADFNNDGWLDLVMVGSSDIADGSNYQKGVATVFRNNGNGTFTAITSPFVGVSIAAASWGDYDNDGFLDLLYGGMDTNTVFGTPTTRLYHNNGNGTFTQNTSTTFLYASLGDVTWGDYDNDGYQDILIAGQNPGGAAVDSIPYTKLYHNNHGNGTFTEVTTAVFKGVNGLAKISFGDYDNDGYQDVLICGRTTRDWTNPQSVTKLYHNNHGDGTFTENTLAGFAPVGRGFALFGDFNNDGYLDVIVNGLAGPNNATPLDLRSNVYINNAGNGTFTAVGSTGIPGMYEDYAAIGDYDGDGKLDVLATGYSSASGFYKGNGDGTFTQISLGSTELAAGGVAWGDYNGDGYFDAIKSGTLNGVSRDSTILYRNSGTGTSNPSTYPVNDAPTAPSGLTASINLGSVTLAWNASTDSKTPSPGLTYALRVGTTSGGVDEVSPGALGSGKRLNAFIGPLNHVRTYTLKGLKPGLHYWSVQAIDNGYAGSAFSTESVFSVPLPAKVKVALQGPYSTPGDSMLNTLRTTGTLASHFAGPTIPARAVDSITVELRDSLQTAQAHRHFAAAWLLTDGSIRNFPDATKDYVTFDSVSAGSYYLGVWHRNHLAVLSASRVTLNGSVPSSPYDFTSGPGQAYGTNPMILVGTKYCLYAGDGNGDGQITTADFTPWLNNATAALTGYKVTDYNLDGQNTTADFTMWLANAKAAATSQVP